MKIWAPHPGRFAVQSRWGGSLERENLAEPLKNTDAAGPRILKIRTDFFTRRRFRIKAADLDMDYDELLRELLRFYDEIGDELTKCKLELRQIRVELGPIRKRR